MKHLETLAKLKLNGLEKAIVTALYTATKHWITESNQISESFKLTANELHQMLKENGGQFETEISWSVQILLDLDLIEKNENKIALTKTGRLYGAFMNKELSI
jgi:hypothetical protein